MMKKDDERSMAIRLGSWTWILRCAKQLSQEEVAEKLGLTQETLDQIERGKETINIDLLDKVALLFGLEPKDLRILCTTKESVEKVLFRAARVFDALPGSKSPELN